MKDALILGGSALVVAIIVLIAWALGFRNRARIANAADARAAFAAADADAVIAELALDQRFTAAIARLTDGRIALAKAVADDVAARVLRREDGLRVSLRQTKQGWIADARTPELGFPDVRLRLSDPPDWLKALAQP